MPRSRVKCIYARAEPDIACDPALARTVVFESGAGDTLDIWQTLQPRVARQCAKTFSYNRAGYPGSEAAIGPRDAAAVVAELREELRRQHLEPPYVLVGHSLGGLYMQYFARNFPAEVAGLLLIDSTHWRQELKVDATANTPYQTRTVVTVRQNRWNMRRLCRMRSLPIFRRPVTTSLPIAALRELAGCKPVPAARRAP